MISSSATDYLCGLGQIKCPKSQYLSFVQWIMGRINKIMNERAQEDTQHMQSVQQRLLSMGLFWEGPSDEVQVQCGSQMVSLNARTKCRLSTF